MQKKTEEKDRGAMNGSSGDRSHERKHDSLQHGGQGHGSHDQGHSSHGQEHSSHGHDKSANDEMDQRSRHDTDKQRGSKHDDSAHRPQSHGQHQPRK